MALQAFSFKTKDIEDAMTNTLLQGGDLHSALDWLCLNLSDGKSYYHKILSVSKTLSKLFWQLWHLYQFLNFFSLLITYFANVLYSFSLFTVIFRDCSPCRKKFCTLLLVVYSHFTVHLIQQILKVCLPVTYQTVFPGFGSEIWAIWL